MPNDARPPEDRSAAPPFALKEDLSGGLIPADWSVPPVFRRRLGDRAGRQRSMSAEGHLLLVLHTPPQTEEHDRQARLFWRQPDGTWRAGNAFDGARALSSHFAEYQTLIDDLEKKEDAAQSAEDYFAILSVISGIYRAARNQHLALQQAREQVPDARDVINFRDRAYELEREADLLSTDARNAMEFLIARRTEEQAQASYQMALSSHRLNVLAAFFFPIATLSTIFGMSLRTGLEELQPPVPFLTVITTGLLFGVILKSILNRSQR